MKQKNFLKTAFLLLVLLGGVSAAWADGTINIPQASAGTYIPIGNASTNPKTTATGVTLTGCQVDGSAETSYTVGSTNGSTVTIEFALTATESGSYLFSFKSGNYGGSATVSLSLKNSSDEVVWNNSGNNVSISNTGAWALTEAHTFLLGNLETGNYTMTLTGVTKSGNYYGNFGNFCFHTATTLPMPNSESNLLNVAMATMSGMKINGTYLTEITTDSYADNMYMYVSNDGYYSVYAGYGYATAGTDNFTITITDMATGTAEVNAKNYTVTDSKKYLMTDKITAGWKKIRLDHPCTTITSSFRLEKMYFTKVDEWPLVGATTTYLDLSSGTFGFTGGQNTNPQYESANENIGYVKDGGYAEYVVDNENETAYYAFRLGISNTSGGTIKVTITDLGTSATEVEQNISITSGSSYADQMFTLTNAISPGLKKIHLDFSNTSHTGWLFNFNHVTFYKRSMNEAYDYTPVAAENVNVVLTRTIKAGNWSTICLPFGMTANQVTSTFGSDTKLAGISEYTSNILNTVELTTITANVPCFIKVANNFSSATINGVTIEEGTPEKVINGSGFKFVGVYTSTEMAPGDFFVANNQLYKATDKTTNKIKPFRAYFTGVSANARLAFFDDETTGVNDVRSKMEDVRGDFYNLAGQRVAQPTKGLYIVNGKKVVIK